MSRNIKITGGILIGLVCFYALQYVGTAIHFGCQDPAEDCPPPIYAAGEIVYRVLVQPPWLKMETSTPTVESNDLAEGQDFTERYSARVDRVDVTFEHTNFTRYRLKTNDLVREGELNTERGFEDDIDATVFVLNWQQPEGQHIYYVRLTNDPTHLYFLDSNRKIIPGSALTRQE